MVNSGFAEDVYQWHKEYPDMPLRFFWDRWEEEPVKRIDDTLSFYQLDDTVFLRQMAGCKAYASTAGFESICEAMYFRKPILMVGTYRTRMQCIRCDAERGRNRGRNIQLETPAWLQQGVSAELQIHLLGTVCRKHYFKRTGESCSYSLWGTYVHGGRICLKCKNLFFCHTLVTRMYFLYKKYIFLWRRRKRTSLSGKRYQLDVL